MIYSLYSEFKKDEENENENSTNLTKQSKAGKIPSDLYWHNSLFSLCYLVSFTSWIYLAKIACFVKKNIEFSLLIINENMKNS